MVEGNALQRAVQCPDPQLRWVARILLQHQNVVARRAGDDNVGGIAGVYNGFKSRIIEFGFPNFNRTGIRSGSRVDCTQVFAPTDLQDIETRISTVIINRNRDSPATEIKNKCVVFEGFTKDK